MVVDHYANKSSIIVPKQPYLEILINSTHTISICEEHISDPTAHTYAMKCDRIPLFDYLIIIFSLNINAVLSRFCVIQTIFVGTDVLRRDDDNQATTYGATATTPPGGCFLIVHVLVCVSICNWCFSLAYAA